MSQLIAKYEVKSPAILIRRDEMDKLKPIELATNAGSFIIYPPRPGMDDGHPSYHTADTLFIDAIVDVDPSADEKEFLASLDREVRKHAHRFLRLLRHKLPETPFPLPAELTCKVTYERVKTEPNWQLIASIGPIIVRAIPRDAGLTDMRWRELENEFASGRDTELWEDFLLDSKVALAGNSLISAVLYAAIASETFIKQLCDNLSTKLSKKFWHYLNSREPEVKAIRYYGPILHLVTGHSLEDENKKLYASLKRVFEARNTIMHQGKRSFSDDERRNLINDINAAQQAISWVLKLNKE